MPKLYNYHRFENILPKDTVIELLHYCEANEKNFTNAEVGLKNRKENQNYRVAATYKDLDKFKDILINKVQELMPEIYQKLGMKPFEIKRFEMEIAAHGDGAFFKQHIDTHTADDHRKDVRTISAVYYFFNEPKAFKGGELSIIPILMIPGKDKAVNLSPISNSLVVFPSFGPHEVLPVSAKEVSFKNYRFAINCWINK